MSSPKILSDEKTIQLAQKKVKGTNEEKQNKSGNIKKNIAHMIIDFNILPYVVSFTIAIAFSDLIKNISIHIIEFFNFKVGNTIISSFLSFILILVITYVFSYLFFYKYIYTEDIAKENIVKNVINE